MAAFYDTNRPLFVPGKLANIVGILRTWGFDERAIMDHHDKYAALFDYLGTALVYDEDLTPDDYVPFNQKNFVKMFGSRYAKTVLHNAETQGIIECDHVFYHPRPSEKKRPAKSLGYRFAPAFRSKLVCLNFLKPESLGRKLDLRTTAKRAAAAKSGTEAAGDQLLARITADVNQLRIHRKEALARNEAVYERTLAFLAEHRTLLSRATCPIKCHEHLLDIARLTDEAITLPPRTVVASRMKTARAAALNEERPLTLT